MSEFISIRNRENVKNNGEVFTPDDKVTDMLNEIPLSFWVDSSACVIEPTCGNGQFLTQVVEFKINNGLTALEAFNTTIGMDISAENITESQNRLYKIACDWMRSHGIKPMGKEWKELSVQMVAIVRNNIVKVPDSLKVMNDFAKGKGKLADMKFVFSDPTGHNEVMKADARQSLVTKVKDALNSHKAKPTITLAPFFEA